MYSLNEAGIWTPERPVMHRDDEYDSALFSLLAAMQQRHFWYAGRHRFLRAALMKALGSGALAPDRLRAVDVGGGCGGWVRFLRENSGIDFAELALADSSLRALELARESLPPDTPRYQVDLFDLKWRDRWDLIFLLDVLEHIEEEKRALVELQAALRPGGLLFITTPALRFFWSWNDEAVQHHRRYSHADFQRLADAVGMELLDSRYFMFFLSPLYLLARWKRPSPQAMTRERVAELVARTHRIPNPIVNMACRAVFCAETPLGLRLRFPWGTSILAVLRKPGPK